MTELLPLLIIVLIGLVMMARYLDGMAAREDNSTALLVSLVPVVVVVAVMVAFQATDEIFDRQTAINLPVAVNVVLLLGAVGVLLKLGAVLNTWRSAIESAVQASNTLQSVTESLERLEERVAELERFRVELESRNGNRRQLGGDDVS